MIYTIDTIPAKIFFKIHETGDVKLLSDNDIEEQKLQKEWDKIVKEDEVIAGNNTKTKKSKALNLSRLILKLNTRLEMALSAVAVLNNGRNDTIEQLLKKEGYKLTTTNFYNDLQTIKREINGVKMKIGRYQKELKILQKTEQHKGKKNFEMVLIELLVFLEFPFKEANTITLLEFRAIEKQAVLKVKNLKKHKKT